MTTTATTQASAKTNNISHSNSNETRVTGGRSGATHTQIADASARGLLPSPYKHEFCRSGIRKVLAAAFVYTGRVFLKADRQRQTREVEG